ncbi:unnamed protein product [Gongylonema pulchrum]|uniref:DNA-binding protein n=1 Tax=Gongylonema pulchrum TaxID=637853 RepID=A0A183D2K8_9BILA|nr:unnamed protein product [Gongylonema pulchrum]
MERSGKNMKQTLRDNIARFMENAGGREVIITEMKVRPSSRTHVASSGQVGSSFNESPGTPDKTVDSFIVSIH